MQALLFNLGFYGQVINYILTSLSPTGALIAHESRVHKSNLLNRTQNHPKHSLVIRTSVLDQFAFRQKFSDSPYVGTGKQLL